MRVRSVAVLALVVLGATPADGQTTLERQALEKQVASGRPVNVTLDGQTQPIVGILSAIGATTIDLAVDGRVRPVPFGAIGRITRKGDSAWSGAMIGAAALGTWCAVICGQGLESTSQYVPAVLQAAVVGGAVGALCDWGQTGTTTLYRKGAPARVSASVSPAGVALNARISWR